MSEKCEKYTSMTDSSYMDTDSLPGPLKTGDWALFAGPWQARFWFLIGRELICATLGTRSIGV